MFGGQKKHTDKQQSAFVKSIGAAGFWLALLAALLMYPRLLDVAGWLAHRVFSDHLYGNFLIAAQYAVFAVVFMIVLSLARATTASTAVVVAVAAVSRLPIF